MIASNEIKESKKDRKKKKENELNRKDRNNLKCDKKKCGIWRFTMRREVIYEKKSKKKRGLSCEINKIEANGKIVIVTILQEITEMKTKKERKKERNWVKQKR